MPMPLATPCYNSDSAPVIARGLEYTEEQLDEAIEGTVKDLLLDTEGTSELNDLLSSLSTTDFEPELIEELLQTSPEPEDWLVGEALAEAYVTDNDNCIFPWPTSRDLKNPEASPAGADLAGFQEIDDEESPYRFAFGEVKTSSDQNFPPHVMYGRTGLKNQLEELRDSYPTKQSLILYLGHHAINAPWRHMFESATKRFLGSEFTDIAIFGVLIRDVTPNEADLSYRASALSQNCPPDTSISLYAIYLPTDSISSLPEKSIAAIQGGGQ